MKLTVYHDGQFWVGVVEDVSGERLKACRFLFGAEPHDAEVLDFVRMRMNDLLERTTQTVDRGTAETKRINPKRLARLAAAEMQQRGVSSYADEALKQELAHRHKTAVQLSRLEREAGKKRKRDIAVQKAKAKHRGR